MTGASKILTVSYGTFSCTLEGFDDPFNTMKAIAEYFRDLAAEDRYFGAEPPTPDAAMLHRIAEREIQRRVEAKVQDNGVILRAAEEGAVVVEAAPAVVAVPALAEAPGPAVAESVAAQLRRIRESQSAAQTAPSLTAAAPVVAAPVAPQQPDYAEDEHAEDAAIAPPVEAPWAAAEPELPEQLEDILDEAEVAVGDDKVAGDDPQVDLTDEFSDLPEAEDFDLAELAEPAATQKVAPQPAAEDQPSPQAASAQPDDDALLQSLTSRLSQADTAVTVAPAPMVAKADAGSPAEAEDPFDETGLLARLTDPLPEDQPAEDEALASDDAGDAEILASLGTMIDPEGEVREEEPALAAAAPVDAAPQPEPLAPAAPQAPLAAPAPAQRARARVIRIRRAEPAPAPAPTPAPAPAVSALSDEDEAALQAELAALEAELAPAPAAPALAQAPAPEPADLSDDEPEAPAALQPAAQPAATAPTDSHPLRHQRAEDAVNRLIAKADTEMGGEDTRRRRSAIAHLKAAVAATVAERKIVGTEAPARPARLESYREDLDRVVRPRRPGSDGSGRRGEEDSQPRPAPLVLVSEQRIDRPRPATPVSAPDSAPAVTPVRPVMPVRPRRVAQTAEDRATPVAEVEAPAKILPPMAEIEDDDIDAGEANIFADSAGFAEFADRLGANSLPDLLEAAAVYCAEVLNRPEFSRPLVMRQLSGLSGNPGANREDCLRGFGTLLRQGRIAKVKRGMFAVTDRSPYLAEARKLAG